MLAPGHLEALCRELIRRGWWVTAAEKTGDTVLIGFNFIPHAVPTWLKSFELAHADANPEAVEAAIELWRARVLHELENGRASSTVRQMVAEHGVAAVREAMCARSFV